MKSIMEYFSQSFVVRFTGPDCDDEPVAIFRTNDAAQFYIDTFTKALGTSNAVKFRITPLTIVH
jgi:hypothetical protein